MCSWPKGDPVITVFRAFILNIDGICQFLFWPVFLLSIYWFFSTLSILYPTMRKYVCSEGGIFGNCCNLMILYVNYIIHYFM